jgi:hypothetical protein
VSFLFGEATTPILNGQQQQQQQQQQGKKDGSMHRSKHRLDCS